MSEKIEVAINVFICLACLVLYIRFFIKKEQKKDSFQTKYKKQNYEDGM